MSPKDFAELDQNKTIVTDYLSSVWWSLFTKLRSEGFTEEQAMRLVLEYVSATCAPRE